MEKERNYNTPRDCIDRFREEYEFLSNFYPAKLFFDGIIYDNSESAYQAQKLADPDARKQFAHLYADEAKRMGRKVEVREDWDRVKLKLMREIVEAKFTQNPRLARRLAKTGSRPLIEGNRWGDTYWGVDLRTREGENHLGQILMELRERFQKEEIPEGREYQLDRWFGPVDGITVTDADITQLDVQCIVNAANKTLSGGSGVYGAIHREAGPELLEECRTLGGCETGEVRLTGGYRLKASYIIHTVCPVYTRDDESLLAVCYRSCLNLARAHRIHSIAFPVLSIGKFCFPKDKATHTAVNTIRGWLQNNADYKIDVVLSCMDHRIFDLACNELSSGNVISSAPALPLQ